MNETIAEIKEIKKSIETIASITERYNEKNLEYSLLLRLRMLRTAGKSLLVAYGLNRLEG